MRDPRLADGNVDRRCRSRGDVIEHRAKVTSRGRVTIPIKVREAPGARKGDGFVFEVEDGRARVRLARGQVGFADYQGALREGGGMGWDEIDAHFRELRGHDDGRGA